MNPQPLLPPRPAHPTDVIINSFQAARMDSYELFPALYDYRGNSPQRFHSIKSSELDGHLGEMLEIVVTNFHDPATILFSHNYKAFKKPAKPGRLIKNDRWVWQIPYTDIDATIDDFGTTTRFLIQLPVSQFANNPHFGQYIAACRDVSSALFLAIFPYDFISATDLPVTDPNVQTMQLGQNIYHGMTPSCGVKIPGGRS